MFFNVAIVGDLSCTLQDIKNKIFEFDPSIEITVQATDGQSAVQILIETSPDVVFTHLGMPLMDGLKMIETVKPYIPDTLFVILSETNDFTSMQRAMELGVSDYLLKPITREKMHAVLALLLQKTAQRKHDTALQYLSQLVRFNQSNIPLARCDFDCACYQPLLLCLGSYYLYNVSYNRMSNALFHVQNVAENLQVRAPSQAFWCVPAQHSNTFFIVLGWSEGETSHGEAIARIMMDALCAGVDGDPFPVTVVLGTAHTQFRSCGEEYPLLSLMLRQQQVFGRASILRMDAHPCFVQIQELGSVLTTQRYVNYFQTNQKELFFYELKAQLDLWSSLGFTQYKLQRELKQMFKGLQGSMMGKYTTDYDMEMDELLSLSQEYHALWSGLRTILEILWDARNAASKVLSIAEAVENVETYIDVHYTEPITINDLAVSVGYTPAYLSRQYKKMKLVSPMEHLTEMRIRKACALLESCPALKLKQIGELSGYENALYFSRIFKDTIGMSPSAYRARVNAAGAASNEKKQTHKAGTV